MRTFMYATPTFITASCNSSKAAFNDCYSELMLYTVLANSYWVSVYDAYQLQSYAY